MELATRLQDLARKWLSECESAEEAIERIVVEQLVNTLPSDLRIWLSERKPVTSVEAGKLADDYAQARRQVRRTPIDQKEDGGGGGPDKRKCHKYGGEGHFKRNCPVKDEPGADRARASPGRNRTDKGIKCFNCHRYGHMSMNCPDKANFYCGDQLGRSVVRDGKVEGAVVLEVEGMQLRTKVAMQRQVSGLEAAQKQLQKQQKSSLSAELAELQQQLAGLTDENRSLREECQQLQSVQRQSAGCVQEMERAVAEKGRKVAEQQAVVKALKEEVQELETKLHCITAERSEREAERLRLGI